MNHFYKDQPALFELDYKIEGFEWINNISANENIIIFTRNTNVIENTLLVVCNFVPILQENYKIGVPYEGKYKEVFTSDKTEYGGENHINRRVKQAKLDECDGRDYSIKITVPPLGVAIFQYSKINDKTKSKKVTKEKARKSSKEKEASLKEKLAKQVRLADENYELEKSMLAAKRVEEAELRDSDKSKK